MFEMIKDLAGTSNMDSKKRIVTRSPIDKAWKWTESSVADAIQETRHQKADQYTFLRQIPNATSLNKTRTCDAMAMGCWQSNGIFLSGYEIKVTRSDWQREIQDVKKAEAFIKHCHYWYVAAPDGVVKLEELPATWGLVVVSRVGDGYKSKLKRSPTHNKDACLDWDFFAACLRRCKRDDIAEIELNRKLQGEYHRGIEYERQRNTNDARVIALEKNLQELQSTIREFEVAAGQNLKGWGMPPRQIGEAIKYLIHHGTEHVAPLDDVLNWLQREAKTIEKLRDQFAVKIVPPSPDQSIAP